MSAIVIYENDGTVSYTLGPNLPTGALAIDFPYFFPDEITVTRIDGQHFTLLHPDTDYTLTGVIADDGFHSGQVVLLPPGFTPLCTIRINRFLRTDKSHNFPEMGAISIPGMNTLFSRLFSWIQDLSRRTASQEVEDRPSAFVGPSPPPSAAPGDLWFWSEDALGGGVMYLFYDDGTTMQWVPVNPESGYLRLSGGTMTGPILGVEPLPATDDLTVPTTNWVNDRITGALTGSGGFLPLTGGTMTGHIALPITPAAANAVRKDYVDTADALKAPLASPVFTGNPTAPTPTAGDNDTSIATTAFVATAVTGVIGGSIPVGPAGGDLAGTFPNPTIKASVALTGNPTAPTAAPGDNDTSVATTAFVMAAAALRAPADGYLYGMTLSNNGTTGVNFAPGKFADATGAVVVTNPTAMNKLISATWAAGTGAGGLGSGVTRTANTWYALFGGIVTASGLFDAYYDTSFVGANKPAALSAIRRLGFARTGTGGTPPIMAFGQDGNEFWWSSEFADYAGVTGTALRTVMVPPGPRVIWHGLLGGSGDPAGFAITATVPGVTGSGSNAASVSGGADSTSAPVDVLTNTAAQVLFTYAGSSTYYISTRGWTDFRGQNG